MKWNEYPAIQAWNTQHDAPLEGDTIGLSYFNFLLTWDMCIHALNLAVKKFPDQSMVVDITLTSGHLLYEVTSGYVTALDADGCERTRRKTFLKVSNNNLNVRAKDTPFSGVTPEELKAPSADYTVHLGSAPILMRGSDVVIGALTVHGLDKGLEYGVAIETLKKFAEDQRIKFKH